MELFFQVKVWKLVNCAQIVDIVAVERAVLGILASNLKSQEQYEIVMNNIEKESEKQDIVLGEEENKIVKASKSFMNQMLKTSVSLKKKITEFEKEERTLMGEETGKGNNQEAVSLGK